MELTLNLAWLVISAVLLVVCGWRGDMSQERCRRSMIVFTLLCVICLLFPVISMTDDLNSSPALPEASKLKKMVLSSQIVVALLDRLIFQFSSDKTWTATALQIDFCQPSLDLLTFNLNRRPPPSPDLAA